jgi:hypothetical protein
MIFNVQHTTNWEYMSGNANKISARKTTMRMLNAYHMEIGNALVRLFFLYMFWRQFEMLPLGLASKLGFHPSTEAFWLLYLLVHPKQPPIGP